MTSHLFKREYTPTFMYRSFDKIQLLSFIDGSDRHARGGMLGDFRVFNRWLLPEEVENIYMEEKKYYEDNEE